jgi:hypothetical protein
MNKKIFFLFLFCSLFSFSQDTIFKKNNDVIPCKIVYSSDSIFYFRTSETQKELSIIKKSEVSRFIHSQKIVDNVFKRIDFLTLGFGGGQDFGGIGFNLVIYPHKNIGLFAGAGFMLVDLSYNVGVKLRKFRTKENSKISPFLTVMYGYTSAFRVIGNSSFNKIYYGFTPGIGLDYKKNSNKQNYWSFGLNYPLRSKDEKNYFDYLNGLYGTKSSTPMFPITFSIGYKRILEYRK